MLLLKDFNPFLFKVGCFFDRNIIPEEFGRHFVWMVCRKVDDIPISSEFLFEEKLMTVLKNSMVIL